MEEVGHNCGTCNKTHPGWSNCPCPTKMRRDDHPADLHPCEHGEAIVASAVAGVEFRRVKATGSIIGEHKHGDDVLRWFINPPGVGWYSSDNKKFCDECGLRMPSLKQLPEMYEKWMEEHGDGK